MKAVLALLLLAMPAKATELGDELGQAVAPAYRAVERISDGAFRALRGGAAPKTDSFAAFRRHFARKEERALIRLKETYDGSDAWGRSVIDAHQSAAVAALGDALMDRYELPRLGRETEVRVRDRRRWTPRFLAAAGVLGGGIAYASGIHGRADAAGLRWEIDVKPGHALQRAIASRSSLQKAAEVEAGLPGSNVSLAAAWGVERGALRSESVGAKYRLRY